MTANDDTQDDQCPSCAAIQRQTVAYLELEDWLTDRPAEARIFGAAQLGARIELSRDLDLELEGHPIHPDTPAVITYALALILATGLPATDDLIVQLVAYTRRATGLAAGGLEDVPDHVPSEWTGGTV